MACNLPSLTNPEVDSILGRELEMIAGAEKAEKVYFPYFQSEEFKQIFGDYEEAFHNGIDADSFKDRVYPETGEPKLEFNKALNKHYFTDKNGERRYYPYERVGLAGVFSTNQIKELAQSIALNFAKANNLHLNISKLESETSDKDFFDFIDDYLDNLAQRLEEDDFILAAQVEESLLYTQEWADEVTNFFKTIGIKMTIRKDKVEVTQEEEVQDEEFEEEKEDQAYEQRGEVVRKASFEKASKTNMLSNVKMFLSLIEHTEKNSFGLFNYVPFDDIYSTLNKTLSDTIATRKANSAEYEDLYDVFLQKIKSLENLKPYMRSLIDKLEDPNIATDRFKNQFVSAFFLFKKNFLGSEFSKDDKNNVSYSVKNLSNSGTRQSNIVTAWYDNLTRIHSNEKLVDNINDFGAFVRRFNTDRKKLNQESFDIYKTQARNFLSKIGVTTSPQGFEYFLNNNENKQAEYEEQLDKFGLLLNTTYKRIVEPLLKDKNREAIFDANPFKTQGTMIELAQAEAFFMEEMSDASIFTLGKTKWAYSNPSYLDIKFAMWKADPSMLLAHYNSNPYYHKNSHIMRYLLGMSKSNGYQYNEQLAKERLAQVEVGVFNSLQEEGDSINASENDTLSYTDALVDYIHKVLGQFGTGSKSWFKTALAADKATEYQINYGVDLVQANTTYDKATNSYNVSNQALNIFLGYFLDEYARMNKVAKDITAAIVDESIELVPNYHLGNKNGLKSQLFPELSPEFKKGDLPSVPSKEALGLSFDLFDEAGMPLHEELTDAQKTEFRDKYIKPTLIKKIRALNDTLLSENIISYNEKGILVNNSIDKSIFDFYSQDSTSKSVARAGLKLAGDLFVNGVISQVEYNKMFTGDMAYYKHNVDFRKRVPATYTDGLYLNVHKPEDLEFNVAVMETINIDAPTLEYMKEYTSEDVWKQYTKEKGGVDTTDAQAWITPKRWRFLLEKMGKWTDIHDEVWEEMNKKVPNFTAPMRKALAQPLKGVYFDVKDGRPVYLKYSQAVLVPNLVRNSPTLSKILTKMQNQNIDELVTSGGIKVGYHIPEKIHDDNGNLKEDFKFKVLKLNNKYWKLQQDLPTKGIKLTDVGSQIQKNIFQALVHHLKANFTLDNGTEFTGDEMIDYLNELSSAILYKNQEKVYNELGIDRENYTIKNEDLLYKRIIEQLEKRRDVPLNLLNGLKMGISPFGIPGGAEIFQNVFSTIINNKINKIQTNGGGFIQMADFGLTKNEAEDKGVKFTPWFLEGPDDRAHFPKFETVNGRKKLIPAGIFIPASLISKYIPDYTKYTPEELFGKKDENGVYRDGLIDSRILDNIIGYRIPNQALVSNDAYRVLGILPEAMGDTVVSYAGITKKTGSDYDIDKLYLMTPSLFFNKANGRLVYETPKYKDNKLVPLDQQPIGALRNMLINAYKNILLQGSPEIMDKVMRPLDQPFLEDDINNLNRKQDPNSFDNYDAIADLETKVKFKTSKAGLGVAVNNTMDFVRGAMGDLKVKGYLGWGHVENGNTKLDKEYSEELSDDDLKAYVKDYNMRVPVDEEITFEDVKKYKKISIADTFMALTNGFVDVANNPFIVEGNWVNQTNNMAFMLVRAGIHPYKINAFLNQPIIKEYVAFKNNVESKTVASANNPVMTFKLKKIAASLSNEDSDIITINDKSLTPRKLFYSIIPDLEDIEYMSKSMVDKEDKDSVERLVKYQKAIEEFQKSLLGKIANKFNIPLDAKSIAQHPAIKQIAEHLTEQFDTVMNVEVLPFDKIDLYTLRKQNVKDEMDIDVQESVLNQYLIWTKVAKSVSTNVTASRTDVVGKGKNIASQIVNRNRLTKVMNDPMIIGFQTKYERNGKRTALGTSTDLAIKEVERIMFANPKYFAPYRKATIQTFNTISQAAKGDVLTDEKLANKLLRSYTTYLLSGFKPFTLSDAERVSIIDDTPALLKQLQKDFPDNRLLQELYLREAGNIIKDGKKVGKKFQIALSSAKKTASVKNTLTDSFRDLLETRPKEAEQLIKYAFLTSGGVQTLNQFYEFIPYEWFNKNGFNSYLNEFLNKDFKEMDTTFAIQHYRHNLQDRQLVKTHRIGRNDKNQLTNVALPANAKEYNLGLYSIFQTTYSKNVHEPFVHMYDYVGRDGDQYVGAYYILIGVTPNNRGVYARTTHLGSYDKTGARVYEYDLSKDGIVDVRLQSAFESNRNESPKYNPEGLLQYIQANPDNIDLTQGAFGEIKQINAIDVDAFTPEKNTGNKLSTDRIKDAVNKPLSEEESNNEKKLTKNLEKSEKNRIFAKPNVIENLKESNVMKQLIAALDDKKLGKKLKELNINNADDLLNKTEEELGEIIKKLCN